MSADDARAELLDRLRRSGIRIDLEGELWHENQRIEHEGLRRALFRWLDRTAEGRYVFRLDETRFAHVDVADTPLVARAARWEGDALLLALSDGNEERLDPATLTIDEAGILRCEVRGGHLKARLANSAATVLAEHLDADGFALHIDGHVVPIPRPARGGGSVF